LAFPELSRDIDRGWIFEGHDRILSFRVTTFQKFVDSLVGMAGTKVAEILLYTMGASLGHIAFHHYKEKVQSEEDLQKVFDKVLASRGWGRCVRITKTMDPSKSVYAADLTGSPFSYERKALEPTCHILRGAVAGFIEASLNKKATSSAETTCASMGAPHCTFQISF